MRKILAILAVICMFWQCSPCRHCPKTYSTERNDSVRVEYRERLIHDTIDFVPPEFYASQTSNDTVSVIENDYAKTTAVWHDGMLSHDLQSKSTSIKVPVTVQVRDTIIIEREATTSVIEKEVEKPLTAWQRFLIALGKICVVVLALAFAAGLIRLFSLSRPS